WHLENPNAGTLTGAVLQTPMFAMSGAVVSKLTASYMSNTGVAQVTIVAYRKTGPQQDFFFNLPYLDNAGDQNKPLDFSTAVPGLDVFCDVDTTGSMGGEINNTQQAINTVITPGIRMAVMDSQFGAGSMQDFPLGSYGSQDCDEPFRLLQP